jgi:hypothetical protein
MAFTNHLSEGFTGFKNAAVDVNGRLLEVSLIKIPNFSTLLAANGENATFLPR